MVQTLVDRDGDRWTYKALTGTRKLPDCPDEGCMCGGAEYSLQYLADHFGPLADGPTPTPMPSID